MSPRDFSFNNPRGACSSCDGLGVSQYFDESKVVVNEELSLSGGAIRGWDKRNVYYYQLLLSLSRHYGFSLVDPYNTLSDEVKSVLLYGSGNEEIEFSYLTHSKSEHKRIHTFEGVIPNLKRRYRKSDSVAVKEDIAQYLVVTRCRSCDGARICESSRNVYIEGTNLPCITRLSIKKALAHFEQLQLMGTRAQIADKILKEIRARLGFLVDVGLDYLSLEGTSMMN